MCRVLVSSYAGARADKTTTIVSENREVTKLEVKQHLVVEYNNLWRVGNSTSKVVGTNTDDTEVVEDTTDDVLREVGSETLETVTPSVINSHSYPRLEETLSKDDLQEKIEDYHNRSLLREGFQEEKQKQKSGSDAKETAHAGQKLVKKGSGDKVRTISAPLSARILARESDLNNLAREPGLNVNTDCDKNPNTDSPLETSLLTQLSYMGTHLGFF